MKIFAKYRFVKIFLLLLVVYSMSIAAFDVHLGYHRHLGKLDMVTRGVIDFVGDNKGRLPISKEELGPYIEPANALESFQIRYGTQPKDLHEENGKLYDRQGNQILLVKGNAEIPFTKRKYEKSTLEIFKKSIEKSEENENNGGQSPQTMGNNEK